MRGCSGCRGLTRLRAMLEVRRGPARDGMGSQQGSSVSYSYLKYKGLAHLNLATCAAHNFDHPNELDLALLRLPPEVELRPLVLGDSDSLRVGDLLLALLGE